MKPCAICGFRHKGAKKGSRYCEWCDRSLNGPPAAAEKKRPRWCPPEETVRGLARLVRSGVLIP